MKKSYHINFRVTDNQKLILDKLAQDLKTTLSGAVRSIINKNK